MWLFGRHRHLSPEALSEYLDGRLHGSRREKVSRQLNSCSSCREELDSLRSTAALLRDLPDTPVPRSFTLPAPPPVLVAQSLPRPFRAPSWAYAGAASLAGLALAVMVSADAIGLLAPQTVTRAGETFESLAAQAPGTAPASQPTPAPAPSADSAEARPPAQAEDQSAPPPESAQQAMRAAEATKSDDGPQQVPATPTVAPNQAQDSQQDTMSTEPAPAPQAAPAEEAGASGPQGAAGPAGPAGEAATEGPQPDKPGDDAVTSRREESSAFAQSRSEADVARETPTSEPGPTEELVVADEAGTPLLWRVLEGVAATLLVVFLAVLVWQRRKARRSLNS